jgi:hypothetical protein
MQDNSISEQINEIKNLQPGWFDGAGSKYDDHTLDYIKDFLIKTFDNCGYTKQIYIYPFPDQGVSVESDYNNISVYLCFYIQEKFIDFHITNLYDDDKSVYESFPMKESSIELIKNQLKNLEE